MSTSDMTGLLATLLVGGAVAVAVGVQVAAAGGSARTVWAGYLHLLDRDVRFLQLKISSARIATLQLCALGAMVFFALLFESVSLAFLVPMAAVAPLWYLARRRDKRLQRIDGQLPFWLLSMSNALKASASIGEALASSTKLVPAPLSQEIELCLKEIKLGASVDTALQSMQERVNSAMLATAVSTLLVARKTGGNLMMILEDTAAALREMERLEGVVRTKTAEGKAQAYLMAAMPFGLAAAMNSLDPTWLSKLTDTGLGNVIVGIAGLLWLAALLLTRKIIAVDV